ncbi:MAG: hypothetical protein C4563_03165 [Desulfobulbus sp.]|nr:MAG: hypothetical protein C4563_03165 [Desulfobulbus sp.]
MGKKNCWEVMRCELRPGGRRVNGSGSCPVSTCVVATGINGGLYGGRSCWAIEKTLCSGKAARRPGEKPAACTNCPFYHQVREEEGDDYWGTPEIRRELEGYKRY